MVRKKLTKQDLIDEVIRQLKIDLENGDETVLDELLGYCPIENLVYSLSEMDGSLDKYLKAYKKGYLNE